MHTKLSIPERLKDLRVVDKHLTLEQLAEQTGLSKSALSKYESDDYKDISPFAIVTLAKFYHVTTDYLLGVSEQKNHSDTELSALHLSDDAIDVLKTGKFNPRLLSEILCHHDFQKMMLDAEIYVDRIADMRISDMNAVLQAVRQMVLMQQGETENDLYLRTLELAQIQEDEYFNALQIKFAYAVTCHKAQGGQWDAVFIDPGWMGDEMMDDEYWRWLYTAFTRARKKLYLINFKDELFGDSEIL